MLDFILRIFKAAEEKLGAAITSRKIFDNCLAVLRSKDLFNTTTPPNALK